jgi:uroporphyrin-III C-methyltransferase/precorrin-2 dehydrogenase/sirohydrochlorin ferrochelatase
MQSLLPIFLNLNGRDVVLVGGGGVAAAKLHALIAAGARVRVVAPTLDADIERAGADAGPVGLVRRQFVDADLDGAWLVVAAATPEVNRQVAAAAEARRVFVNAVDDPANATAFLSGTIRRDGVTLAISTNGDAPALTALVREALDALLPDDLGAWVERARRARTEWRQAKVEMASRKPLLLDALNELYNPSSGRLQPAGERPAKAGRYDCPLPGPAEFKPGHVSLVGAGPGDPALLTRKALARLRAADLVLYDALIDDRVLRYARKAQRFFVGKRAGRQALGQTAIHTVMIRAARRGRLVVRLKGGDPFVFGRGGEEALALQQAGVSFDVVPGITSAVAAPELAGIPVTHRGRASAFLVVSGHDVAGFQSAIHELPANGLTLVVMMGVAKAARIAQTLTAGGWSRQTPAAIIINASLPDQRVWRGRLDALADGAAEIGEDGPGTIVIGSVVELVADVKMVSGLRG